MNELDDLDEKFEKYLDEEKQTGEGLLLALDYAERYYDLIRQEQLSSLARQHKS